MRRGLYGPYKGPGRERRDARARIVAALRARGELQVRRSRAARLVDDAGGDALDSVVAAVAVAGALRTPGFPRPGWHPDYAREAMVYD
jgi:hypothetical protein